MIFDAGVSTINKQTSSLLHLQQQVASGRRMLSPSDDPVAAARALEGTQSQDVNAQFKLNHNNANSALGLEEAQLSSSTDLLARVRELAVQAGNSSLANSDRRAITTELRARFEELTGIANATDGSGQYLFSGFMGATKPFGGSVESILAGGEVIYSGDDGQRKLQVSPTRFLDVSDSGNDVFKRIRNGNGYFVTDYPKALGVGTNAGTGMIDAGSITDPAKWNASPTKNFSISFSIDNAVVPPVTYYDIIDTDPASATNGNSLLTGAAPVLPPTAVSGQRVYQSGQPIVLKNQGAEPGVFDFGANVSVSGVPADGDSFSIAPSSSQSVFATIAKLIGAMENANTGTSAATANLSNDIGFALTNLDQATDNILRVRAQIGNELGQTVEELAVEMEMDIKKVRHIQKISQDIISLESPVGSEEDSKLGDFIEDEDAVNPFDATNRQLRKENVHAMLEFLTPRERKIIEMRFGLRDGIGHTLEEVGKEFGVTRERIRQIEAKVLQKMRDHPRSMTIREQGGSPKRVGFSPVQTFLTGKLCPECRKGTLIDVIREGKNLKKCDHCAYELKSW